MTRINQSEANALWAKAKTAKPCAVCKIIKICPACHQHCFPANEVRIAESDREHGGVKQPACICSELQRRGKRKR